MLKTELLLEEERKWNCCSRGEETEMLLEEERKLNWDRRRGEEMELLLKEERKLKCCLKRRGN